MEQPAEHVKFGCASCSKESYDSIPIIRIIDKLDELFSKNDLSAVGRLLDYWDQEARILSDEQGLLEILNEKIGYFRRTCEAEKALAVVEEAFNLIEMLCAEEHVSSATVYLNGATTMKAFGKTAEAMKYYEKARKIYEKELKYNDYRFAAYYNNISSAYKELGDFKNAEDACFSALDVLSACGGYLGEMAVTHVNLAHIYYDVDSFDDRIYEHMENAWELLSGDGCEKDGNYAFICSKCYPSFGFFGYFEYEKKLKELVEKIYEGN